MRLNSFLTCNTPEPSVFGSRQCTRAHFHSLWARVVSPILVCLGPSSTPGSTFTPRRLGLSHPSPLCLGSSSALESTFTPHGLGLSRLSQTCLGPGCALGPTFTSYRLGYLHRAQHSLMNFF
jgi:hypothetical protein